MGKMAQHQGRPSGVVVLTVVIMFADACKSEEGNDCDYEAIVNVEILSTLSSRRTAGCQKEEQAVNSIGGSEILKEEVSLENPGLCFRHRKIRNLYRPKSPAESLHGFQHRTLKVKTFGHARGKLDRFPAAQTHRATRAQRWIGAAHQRICAVLVPDQIDARMTLALIILRDQYFSGTFFDTCFIQALHEVFGIRTPHSLSFKHEAVQLQEILDSKIIPYS